MSNVFADTARRLGRAPCWIDFEAYAAKVFAGGPADWLRDAHRYAATLSQAHRLVRSDFVSVRALAPHLADGAWDGSADRSLDAALRGLSAGDAAHRFVGDALDALFHRLDGQASMVIELPSPSALLRRRGATPPFDFDDLDACAMALAAVLRDHSERRFVALTLACDEPEGLSEDEREACMPLVKSARYYGWSVALRLDHARADAAPSADAADVTLLAGWPLPVVEALGPWAGGGLGPAYWRDEVPLPRSGLSTMLFGVIPTDAVPERVAAQLERLHGRP